MAVSIRKVGDVVIIDLSGRFEIGPPLEEFRRAMRLQLQAGMRKFVWNLSGSDYLDSAALGALVSEQLGVLNQGGDVRLVVRDENQ